MKFQDGLIIGHEKSNYRVQVGDRLYLASLRGRLKHAANDATELPAIGDLVRGQISGESAVIEEIQPRRSFLARQAAGGAGKQSLAANVDFVLIATSLNQDFNFDRLDRYFTLAFESGAIPILLLTKKDLRPDWAALKAECESRLPAGVQAIAVSADEPDSLAQLHSFVSAGKVAVLLGSSGVGKSTMANYLLGKDILDTGGIRAGDDRGRHTTTSRSMWRTPWDGWIIDTPGMREVQMLDHEAGLTKAFGDVEDLFGHCRFSDCGHDREPGCAVKGALAAGSLTDERWQNYLKLRREVDFQLKRAARKR